MQGRATMSVGRRFLAIDGSRKDGPSMRGTAREAHSRAWLALFRFLKYTRGRIGRQARTILDELSTFVAATIAVLSPTYRYLGQGFTKSSFYLGLCPGKDFL